MTGICYVLLRYHGGGTDTATAQKVDPGEENVPTAPARAQTRDLSITIPALYH